MPEYHNYAWALACSGPGSQCLRSTRRRPCLDLYDERRPVPDANWKATVYHGLPRSLHTLRERRGEYLAFLGRISPEKRLDRAIAIAREAEMKLKVAAKVYTQELDYYNEKSRYSMNPDPGWSSLARLAAERRTNFSGNAHALLFPIDWPEPFGLVMIEAMACGTPVVAWRNGSVPEIKEDGITGFVVESVEGAVQAVGRISELSRPACRKRFEERYDASRMVQNYLKVYRCLGPCSEIDS